MKDSTTMLGVFWDHQGQAQECADQDATIHAFRVVRGGTYNDNAEWFRRLCAESPLDWRATSRMALEELRRGHRVNVL